MHISIPAVAPSSRAHEVAGRLSHAHNGIETHVIPLPSVDIIGSLLRRDLDSVRNALLSPTGTTKAYNLALTRMLT